MGTRLGRAIVVSGEGLFVAHVSGAGMMWVQSLGAVTSRTLQPGEQWIGTHARCFPLESGALTEMGRWNS